MTDKKKCDWLDCSRPATPGTIFCDLHDAISLAEAGKDMIEKALQALDRVTRKDREMEGEEGTKELIVLLRDLSDWMFPRPDEGWSGFYDRWTNQFYRETRVTAPGKDESVARISTESKEYRQSKYKEWTEAKLVSLEERTRTILAKWEEHHD